MKGGFAKNEPDTGIKSKKEPRLPKNLHVSAKSELLKDDLPASRGDAKQS